MTTQPHSFKTVDELKDQAFRWGKLITRQAFGDQGPGLDVDVDTMEQLAQEVSKALLKGTLSELLDQQAQALPKEQPCPVCGRPCLVRHEPRTLQFRGTPVEYTEPKCHCPACRRDFFPSTRRSAPE